jgi:hypothetical protein
MDVERRLAPRYPMTVPVEMEAGSGATLDVSSTGVYFVTDAAVLPDQEISFTILFEHAVDSGAVVTCRGRVVRVERRADERLGVAATYEPLEFHMSEDQKTVTGVSQIGRDLIS